MSDRKWQDYYLSDIIETQLALFFHLSAALDKAGILPRELSAEALRRTAERNELRPGVKACVHIIADLLERTDARPDGPAWQPRVVSGDTGGEEDDIARETQPFGDAHQAGNGQAANGSLPAGWRPRIVGGDDPDCA